MKKIIRNSLLLSAVFAAGCSTTTEPAPIPSPTPVALPQPIVVPVFDPSAAVTKPPEPATVITPYTPDVVNKQAEAESKAIEQLLAQRAARETQGHNVTVVQPVPSDKASPAITSPQSVEPEIKRITPVTTIDPRSTELQANTGATLAANMPPVSLDPPATLSQPSRESVAPAMTSSGIGSTALEQDLFKRAHEYPRDVASQLDYQLLMFLKEQTIPQSADFAQMPAEDREVVTAIVDGLSNFRNNVRNDNNMLMAKKIRPLIDMSDRLRAHADLTVPTAVLCKDVKGFGLYTPIDPPRFEAGVALKAVIYAEVDNFASQLNVKNLWETRLTQELVLYTESGLPVWNDKTTTFTDESRNRRRDFFLNKIISLPPSLGIGRYVLKVSIVDQNANRVAETSIPITLVSTH